jgi:hypothetical protein
LEFFIEHKMNVMRSLFSIVVVIALVVLLFIAVSAKNSESCQCYFIGECEFDENGVGYRYHWCGGSCAGYASWEPYAACRDPNYKPNKLLD